jgi:hypothetical protein
VPTPEEDVNCVEDAQKSKPPSDRIDNNLLSSCGELEKHGSEEQQVNQGPNPECHWRGCEVSLFGRGVHVVGTSYRVDIGSEGE